jgi:hypothetical protein
VCVPRAALGMLLSVVTTSTNYKTRINAAAALRSVSRSQLGKARTRCHAGRNADSERMAAGAA